MRLAPTGVHTTCVTCVTKNKNIYYINYIGTAPASSIFCPTFSNKSLFSDGDNNTTTPSFDSRPPEKISSMHRRQNPIPIRINVKMHA